MRRTSAKGLITALLLLSALLHPVVHAIAKPHSGVVLSAPDHLRDCPCIHTPVVPEHVPQITPTEASGSAPAIAASDAPETNRPAHLPSRAPPEQRLGPAHPLFV